MGNISDTNDGIFWGTLHFHKEVQTWIEGLSDEEFGRVEWYVELLWRRGLQLREPHTRQLKGKLRELRFHLDRRAIRMTYWIAPGRHIVLLTVFEKKSGRESREVARAAREMRACMQEHTNLMEDRWHT